MNIVAPPLEIFYSFAAADEAGRAELEKHLNALRHEKLITTWHTREVSAGLDWKTALDSHLNSAPSFCSSSARISWPRTIALTIRERALGPEHPDTANSLYWLAFSHQQRGQYEQARPLYERALAIYERVLRTDHPDTINLRDHYESLLRTMEGGSKEEDGEGTGGSDG